MAMTHRENCLAILNYEQPDRIPMIHFGFWTETLQKWEAEGHLLPGEDTSAWDGTASNEAIASRLGFHCGWGWGVSGRTGLWPSFQEQVLEVTSDGFEKVINEEGVIIMRKPGVVSIPMEIGHTLVDRESYEKGFKERLQMQPDRLDFEKIDERYQLALNSGSPICIGCGSALGYIRNIIGVEGLSYLYADDEDLFTEIIDTVADMNYQVTKALLERGYQVDHGHYWEDICFKNGPLVIPSVFDEKCGHHYKRVSELLKSHGVNFISVDCDGLIDSLIPTWLDNGVNIMFPIEVGTWEASIAPWREKYGRDLRGIGGMDKRVFAADYGAIDKEIERLKPLIALGGYIPCVDHRIPPDAIWENVQYFCHQFDNTFNK